MYKVSRSSAHYLVVLSLFMGVLCTTSLAQVTSPAPAGEVQAADLQAEQFSPQNTLCPVTIDEEVDPNFSTVYEGRKIYFCCRRCKSKFEADPMAYLANLPEITPVALNSSQPHDDHGVGDSQSGAEHDVSAVEVHEDEAAAGGEPEHDHATGHGTTKAFSLLPWLGKFHMLVIHFPIALISVAAFFEIAGWLGHRPSFEIIVRATLGLGAISAVGAVLLGLANAIGAEYTGTLSWVFWWHRALGITTGAVGIVAWIAVEKRARKNSSKNAIFARSAVILAATLVGLTGHFGGSLVYGWDYLMP